MIQDFFLFLLMVCLDIILLMDIALGSIGENGKTPGANEGKTRKKTEDDFARELYG